MFPGPHAQVYYNEAGEVLGWSDESGYEPEPYDDDHDPGPDEEPIRTVDCKNCGRAEDIYEVDDWECSKCGAWHNCYGQRVSGSLQDIDPLDAGEHWDDD